MGRMGWIINSEALLWAMQVIDISILIQLQPTSSQCLSNKQHNLVRSHLMTHQLEGVQYSLTA